MAAERQTILALVDEAVSQGARQSKACEVLDITPRTLQRWRLPATAVDRRPASLHVPANKLTEEEHDLILQVVNQAEYAELPPSQIVPALADQGCYIASESSFYRVLRAANQLGHRSHARPRQARPKPLVATAPNQVYCWDITYLSTPIRGIYFYLYMILDIFSRKVVGWQVYADETAALAAELMMDTCRREGVARGQVTLHADNGGPMRGATLQEKLKELGVIPSFSRGSVSNDNPYAESLFRTLKYRPAYPQQAFGSLAAARTWVTSFVHWYNTRHRHSAIQFVTPEQRHRGEDRAILAKRHQLYEAARERHPLRWSGATRNWKPAGEVQLNPPKHHEAKRAA